MYHYRIVKSSLEITDGDSFRAEVDYGFRQCGKKMPFRLYGVDAPETHKPTTEAGKLAKAEFVRLMMEGADPWLYLKSFKDKTEKYGRWLALVFTDPNENDEAESINQQLLRGGFGYVRMLF